MTRILTLALAAAALSLSSCAAIKKDCDSCCASKTAAKKECCAKAEKAGKKCATCESGHKH
ncbi:hypothetical protein DES53_10990 [Roseimicrobium gellanilyticum]|uniref:Lipoprotein n=1 Tax=Roseimicrobium gellanilyticum TaxID=748857 RepID=A0A366HBE8_9BACT|nr:hypothetical protein [Roseimicrobium gellanilyticum]RBP39663.1 hypothetical protein DES53_10990 [Roseimicrobium gellanilyticum]